MWPPSVQLRGDAMRGVAGHATNVGTRRREGGEGRVADNSTSQPLNGRRYSGVHATESPYTRRAVGVLTSPEEESLLD
jgi:hypothetical protein